MTLCSSGGTIRRQNWIWCIKMSMSMVPFGRLHLQTSQRGSDSANSGMPARVFSTAFLLLGECLLYDKVPLDSIGFLRYTLESETGECLSPTLPCTVCNPRKAGRLVG